MLKDLSDAHSRFNSFTTSQKDKVNGQDYGNDDDDEVSRRVASVKQRVQAAGTLLKERVGHLQDLNDQVEFFMVR